jgi:DNA invertase Pin-like site-specific DNA recombinase
MGPGNGNGAAIAGLIESLAPGDTVVITSMDRLARDPAAITRIIRAIQQKGAALVSVTDDFDSRRPNAETILFLIDGGWRGLIRNTRR